MWRLDVWSVVLITAASPAEKWSHSAATDGLLPRSTQLSLFLVCSFITFGQDWSRVLCALQTTISDTNVMHITLWHLPNGLRRLPFRQWTLPFSVQTVRSACCPSDILRWRNDPKKNVLQWGITRSNSPKCRWTEWAKQQGKTKALWDQYHKDLPRTLKTVRPEW